MKKIKMISGSKKKAQLLRSSHPKVSSVKSYNTFLPINSPLSVNNNTTTNANNKYTKETGVEVSLNINRARNMAATLMI
jgi:hypothetical protein